MGETQDDSGSQQALTRCGGGAAAPGHSGTIPRISTPRGTLSPLITGRPGSTAAGSGWPGTRHPLTPTHLGPSPLPTACCAHLATTRGLPLLAPCIPEPLNTLCGALPAPAQMAEVPPSGSFSLPISEEKPLPLAVFPAAPCPPVSAPATLLHPCIFGIYQAQDRKTQKSFPASSSLLVTLTLRGSAQPLETLSRSRPQPCATAGPAPNKRF